MLHNWAFWKKGTIWGGNFDIIAIKFQWCRSKNGQWKLIYFDGPDERSVAPSPVSSRFALCNRRRPNTARQKGSEKDSWGGIHVGRHMWAKLWESEPPPARQFHVQFTDYKLAPHILVSGLATFPYIVIAVILLSSSSSGSLQRNNCITPNYFFISFISSPDSKGTTYLRTKISRATDVTGDQSPQRTIIWRQGPLMSFILREIAQQVLCVSSNSLSPHQPPPPVDYLEP